MAERLIALFPPHKTYIEPFLGGGSVLLNKPRSEHEIAGDVNHQLMTFWCNLRGNIDSLVRDLKRVQYNEETFLESLECFELHKRGEGTAFYGEGVATCNLSVAFLIRNRFSRGGLGKTFAWSERLRGGQPGDVNAWETIRDEFPAIAKRVERVSFWSAPAIETIAKFDAPDALIYADPPYLQSTRSVPKAYAHEMTRDQHVELLDCLKACKGSVILSGYRSDLYDSALTGWRRIEWDIANHSSQSKAKARRTECVWLNFAEGASA